MNRLFEITVVDFIQQQCKNNGGRKRIKDILQTDHQRVAQKTAEIDAVKETLEIIKAHPRTFEKTQLDLEIFEGH